MLHQLKRFVPNVALDAYHMSLSWLAAAWYRHPSEELIVIGVTGTNGKTTTSYVLAKALEAVGDQTGCTTTALFKVGTREWLNDRKMTMLGRFQLQKLLREMVSSGCRYAVIETSSQGIAQHRHRQINYDVAVLTNLTPEHIEAHGSFETYKAAKIELFHHLARSRRKTIGGKKIEKVAVLNSASEHAKDFAVSGIDRVVRYGVGAGEGFRATDLQDLGWSSVFTVDGQRVTVHMPGEVNVENATAAFAVAAILGMPGEKIAKKIDTVAGVPGRFERIEEGQPFTVIVDYAVEPVAMTKLYETVKKTLKGRLIHVFGSCGGGRDVARRPMLGRLAAQHADIAIITDEDPYDDRPQQIIDQIAAGAREAGKTDASLQLVLDRRDAITQAIKQAQPDDVVLITGKGCEQAIMRANGTRVPWDDRKVVREALQALALSRR